MARNEAETRAELIDPSLTGWGWVSGGDTKVSREYQVAPGRILGGGQKQRRLILDYLLEHKGRKVAVLEAKAEDKPLTEGLGQAKDYATKLGVRFAYCTNGLATTPLTRQQVKSARSIRCRALKSFGVSRSVPNQSWPRSFRRFRLKPMGDGSSLAITKSGRLLRCMMRSLPQEAHVVDVGDRDRQDVHRFSGRMEAVSDAVDG